MRYRHRLAAGIFIALCGLAIAAGAAFPWIDASHHHPAAGIEHTALKGVLHWSYQGSSDFLRTFGFAVVIIGGLVFLGGLAGSRLVAGLFGLLAIVAGGLWLGLYTSRYDPSKVSITDLRPGAWLTLGGGLLALSAVEFLHRREY
jgi:hypothetical protein